MKAGLKFPSVSDVSKCFRPARLAQSVEPPGLRAGGRGFEPQAGPTPCGDFRHPPLFQVGQLPVTGKESACTGLKPRKRVRQPAAAI